MSKASKTLKKILYKIAPDIVTVGLGFPFKTTMTWYVKTNTGATKKVTYEIIPKDKAQAIGYLCMSALLHSKDKIAKQLDIETLEKKTSDEINSLVDEIYEFYTSEKTDEIDKTKDYISNIDIMEFLEKVIDNIPHYNDSILLLNEYAFFSIFFINKNSKENTKTLIKQFLPLFESTENNHTIKECRALTQKNILDNFTKVFFDAHIPGKINGIFFLGKSNDVHHYIAFNILEKLNIKDIDTQSEEFRENTKSYVKQDIGPAKFSDTKICINHILLYRGYPITNEEKTIGFIKNITDIKGNFITQTLSLDINKIFIYSQANEKQIIQFLMPQINSLQKWLLSLILTISINYLK